MRDIYFHPSRGIFLFLCYLVFLIFKIFILFFNYLMTDNLTDFKQQVIDLRSLVHTLNMQRMENHEVFISSLRRLKGSGDFFIFNQGG